MSFLDELKRRNVIRAGIAYVVLAWLVLQVADVILNNIASPAWVFQALLLFMSIGLPFVLLFAWAFELTPEGIRRESEVERSQSITPQTGRKLDRMIIVLLLAALGYFAYDKFVLSHGGATAPVESSIAATDATDTITLASPVFDRSIAVLPFVNMSEDAGNEFFSDGLSEELLNLLTKIPELRVAARTSSFSFKGQQLEIPEIAARLKVANILEGSVRKAGNQVRITAQLIKADDGFHLWSETYDRTLENIFAVQDEIAAAVVSALKISLLGATPLVEKTNPEAYSLYLQGRYLFNQRSEENWAKSVLAYRKALEIDPNYAAAWVGLTKVVLSQAGVGYIDLAAGMNEARTMAEHALALDPGLATAWANLSWIQGEFGWQWNEAYASVQKALELEPNSSEVLIQAANLANKLGQSEQALSYLQQALLLDPLNNAAISDLADTYEQLDRLDEAEKTIRQLINLNSDRSGAYSTLAYIQLRKGESEQALATAEQEIADAELWRSRLRSFALHDLGRKAEADLELDSFIKNFHTTAAYQVAQIYAWRQQPDEAFLWLDRAYTNRDPGLSSLIRSSSLRNLHHDPRWEPMLEKVGLLEAWQASRQEQPAVR